MKVADLQPYWSTAGGGETYGAAVAQVLARDHDVDLVGPEEVDLAVLAERLRLDLSGIGMVVFRDRPGAVTAGEPGYDLFVNVSFMSDDDAGAAHNLYIIHFPARAGPGPGEPCSARRSAVLGPAGPGPGGGHDLGRRASSPARVGRPRYFWTGPEASFFVEARPDGPVPVRMVFRRQPAGRRRRPRTSACSSTASRSPRSRSPSGRSPLARRRGPAAGRLRAPPELGEVEVRITSPTFVPAEHGLGDDDRRLGVALSTLHTGTGWRDRLGAGLGAWFPLLYRPLPNKSLPRHLRHPRSPNSEFTRGWIRRWWGRDAAVLYPPVRLHSRGRQGADHPRRRPVLRPDGGHSRSSSRWSRPSGRLDRPTGDAEGWELHLVGGCSEATGRTSTGPGRGRGAAGRRFHVDAPGAELADLYARASIFWHATGLGEDVEAHPERLEHFGIAPSRPCPPGAVPVVIGRAGPAEIVEAGSRLPLADSCRGPRRPRRPSRRPSSPTERRGGGPASAGAVHRPARSTWRPRRLRRAPSSAIVSRGCRLDALPGQEHVGGDEAEPGGRRRRRRPTVRSSATSPASIEVTSNSPATVAVRPSGRPGGDPSGQVLGAPAGVVVKPCVAQPGGQVVAEAPEHRGVVAVELGLGRRRGRPLEHRHLQVHPAARGRGPGGSRRGPGRCRARAPARGG